MCKFLFLFFNLSLLHVLLLLLYHIVYLQLQLKLDNLLLSDLLLSTSLSPMPPIPQLLHKVILGGIEIPPHRCGVITNQLYLH